MAGSAVIGSLRVNLGIDSAEFTKGAKAAQSTLGSLAGAFKGFAAGALAALSVGAITAPIKSAINHMDELGKAAQKIGIPVEELSKLEFAGRLADVSLEQLSTGVGKLSKNMAAIAGGTGGDAGRALAAIGVSAVTANGQLRPTADLIADVAEKFAAMKDGAGKTAIAMALFGKSGAELIPLLNAGKTGLADTAREAANLGIVFDTQAAAAAERFNDNLTRIKAAGEGVTQQIATQMLPALVSVTDRFVEALERGSGLSNWLANDLSQALRDVTAFVMATAQEFRALGMIWEGLSTSVSFSDLGTHWSGVFAKIQEDAAKTKAAIAELYNPSVVSGDGKGSLPTAPVVSSKIEAPIIKTKELTTSVTALGNAGKVAGSQLTSAFGQVGDSAESLGQQLGQTLGSSFSGWISQALDGTFKLKDAFVDLLSQASKLGMNFFLQKLLGGFSGSSLYSGGFGLGSLPGFKDGGSFKVGGSGGIDSQIVGFRATPGEQVDVSTKKQQRGIGVDEAAGTPNIMNVNFNFPPGTDVAGFRRSQSQISAVLTRAVAAGQRNL